MSVNKHEIPISGKIYTIKTLDMTDEESVQQLCERCLDFFELVEGRFPEKTAGLEILTDLPPNKSMEDKYVFGCLNERDNLVAVIDLISDYPEKGEWIIGLLMIAPDEREIGLGKKLHDFIKEYVCTRDGEKLRIAVIEDNKKAYNFWCGLGYYETKRVKMTHGNKENIAIVMNLPLL